MPLTPADVHNVVFKKPPIGKRGYDEDDVDAFLDEVERELARLIEENNDLKAQVERVRSGAGGPPPPSGGGASDGDVRRLAGENNELKGQVERLQREKQQAQQAAQQAQQAAQQAQQQAAQAAQQQPANVPGPPVPPGLGGAADSTGEQQALRVLMLAQRTADDHVADARREADKVLTEARTKADEVTRDSRAKAEALERDARQRHQEAMGGLDAKRAALQKHIEELKAFEREYRTRLKAYLESQLRDLEGRGQAMEAEVNRQTAGASSMSGAFGGPQASSYGLGSDAADSRGR
jgi:DivIVA domain-containing protein